MWVRGLKQKYKEIQNANDVASYVGAWIETSHRFWHILALRSHPMWVRGLKLYVEGYGSGHDSSHPMWVRGLKPRSARNPGHCVRSHPMWVRGLKQTIKNIITVPKCRILCGCVD